MEASDASLGSGDATTRAQELRASLGVRQDAEAMLAEASRVRRDAALAADAMVDEAQQLSEQLVAESRRVAEQITGEARERADDVLGRAKSEAEEVAERARATAEAIRSAAETDIEDHRRRVRAEVTAQVTRDLTEQHRVAEERAHEQSEALISDLEASVRILGVSLESALANVGELLGSLEVLRSAADPASPRVAETPVGVLARSTEPAPPAVGAHYLDAGLPGVDDAMTPVTSVPSATSRFGTEVDDPLVDGDRPRSATEAFLASSSLEVEQASRELRDLQHPEDARRRRSEESRRAAQLRELEAGEPDADPEPDLTNGARPLGWLFRTAQ